MEACPSSSATFGRLPYRRATLLPACRVAEELGKGAFSIVKSATRKADRQKSAVKVVERRKLGKGDLEALRSEAKLLNELDHPNIVKLHGWYEEDTTLYMALELCEGKWSQNCLREVYGMYGMVWCGMASFCCFVWKWFFSRNSFA